MMVGRRRKARHSYGRAPCPLLTRGAPAAFACLHLALPMPQPLDSPPRSALPPIPQIPVHAASGLRARIFLLPAAGANSTCVGCGAYGAWPASGEVDLLDVSNNMADVRAACLMKDAAAVEPVRWV